MTPQVGDYVQDPRPDRQGRQGRILAVYCNPACLLPFVTVRWEDTDELDEVSALEWGPLT